MDLIKLELVLEFVAVLLAPPLYQYYLWRRGKTTPRQVRQIAILFAPLYLLVFAALIVSTFG